MIDLFFVKYSVYLLLLKGVLGQQELLFGSIRALVWTLSIGIVAFSAQLTAQISAGLRFDRHDRNRSQCLV